ncbi:MAG: hypothetical protein WB761_34685, partial [Solirubrobacteraceae bacterium]
MGDPPDTAGGEDGGDAGGGEDGCAGALYVYWSAALVGVVPPGVVTVMFTVPADSAGAVAVMLVALLTVK